VRQGPRTVVAIKGRKPAFEVFREGPEGLCLIGERGVSGTGAYRKCEYGTYPWAKEADEWECDPRGSGAWTPTRVKYHAVDNSVSSWSGALSMDPYNTDTPQAVFDIVLAFRYPGWEIAVREERWGAHFEHVELYIEGILDGVPVGRVGWIKALETPEGRVIQRVSCFSERIETNWRPRRHEHLPGWKPVTP